LNNIHELVMGVVQTAKNYAASKAVIADPRDPLEISAFPSHCYNNLLRIR